MDKEQKLHKELDLIQEVIKRMAANSFQVKTWLIGILTATVAFSKDSLLVHLNSYQNAFLINIFLFLPLLSFWYLDAFFLRTENVYREIYKWVIKYRSKTDDYMYDLNTFERSVDDQVENLTEKVGSVIDVMCSATLIPFYSIPFILILGLFCYNIVCYMK